MTTIDHAAAALRTGDALPTEPKLARNTSPASENKIHEDEIARTYGFRGGLVPGATTYAYLASYLTRRLGPAWAAHGSSTISLVRPVYDGDTITLGGAVQATEGDATRGSIAVECWADGPDGTRCAPGTAALSWGDPLVPEPVPEFARTSLRPRRPEERGTITAASAPVGETLPPVELSAGVTAIETYLDALEDYDPLFREASPFGPPLVHPGWWPGIANRVLSQNFILNAWIHTRSEIRHLAPALPGGIYRAYGTITAAYEKRGHEYVTADVLIVDGGEQPVVRMQHTAIVVVARRA